MQDQRFRGLPINVAAWIVVVLAAALGVAPLVPPEVPADRGPGEFSTARALRLIERLAVEPHPIGTPAIERVRGTIIGELRRLGVEPVLQAVDAPDYFGISGGPIKAVNVLARLPGAASTGSVALVGHYDTVPTTRGANDDSSAVAVMLETARAVLAGPGPRDDLVLVFTDGEEPAPRFGSSAFVGGHPWFDDVGMVINLEAIGGTGPSTLLGVSAPDGWIVDEYASVVSQPLAFSYLTTLTRLIGGYSDFESFRDAGVPGLELAYLHGSSIYHTPADTPDQVDLGSLHQQGATTLALARHLASLDLDEPRDAGDSVYFTIGRSMVVRYPISWALPLALLAGLALVVAAWRRSRDPARRSGVRRGLAGALLATILPALAAAAAWTLLATARSTMGVAESYVDLAGLAVMTVLIGELVTGRLGRRAGQDPRAVVAVWWVLALLASVVAPGLSYLFTWPALAAAIVLGWRSWRGVGAHPREELIGFALVVGTTLILLVPAIDTFFQLAQPHPGNPDSEILVFIVIPVALVALATQLGRAAWPGGAEGSGDRLPAPVG